MSPDERQIILETHLERLKAANTFEEYKAAHIAYVEFIIGRFKIEDQGIDLTIAYVEKPNDN